MTASAVDAWASTPETTVQPRGRGMFADRLSSRRAGLLALSVCVVATFVPRWQMALRRDVLCTDAVYFIARAEALAQGDTNTALDRMGVNLYPAMLAALRVFHDHGLQVVGLKTSQFDYETAGRYWSLLCATATVVPLVLLTRRWFGAGAALAAGFLYAGHAEFIEWSPEIIRDPQFWFLFVTGLELGARWAARGGWLRGIATGAIVSLACLTRSEGWLAAVPCAVWGVWPAVVARRNVFSTTTWLAGGATALALVPLVVGTAFYGTGATGFWARAAHQHIVAEWAIGGDLSSNAVANVAIQTVAASRPSTREVLWGVRHTLLRGAGIGVLSLGLVGWLAAWRNLQRDRRSRIAYDLLAPLVLACVWIYLAEIGEINKRYVLPVVLVTLPYAGFGVTRIAHGFEQTIAWACSSLIRTVRTAAESTVRSRVIPIAQFAIAALLVASIDAHGVGQALSSKYESRYLKAELGTWLRLRYGAKRRLLVSHNLDRLVTYYASAESVPFPAAQGALDLERWVSRIAPEVVVVWPLAHAQTPDRIARFDEPLARLCASNRFTAVDPTMLPPQCREARVLVRREVDDSARAAEASRLRVIVR